MDSAVTASTVTGLVGKVIDAATPDIAGAVTFLVAAVGVVVTLVFMWWGIRKLVRMFMSAFRRGKLSV